MPTYSILVKERPVTFNKLPKTSIWPLHKELERWHELIGWQAKVDRSIPRPIRQRVDITVIHHRKNGTGMPDTAACVIAHKGGQDALVQVGVLIDDNPKYVRKIIFEEPVISGYDGLEFVITTID